MLTRCLLSRVCLECVGVFRIQSSMQDGAFCKFCEPGLSRSLLFAQGAVCDVWWGSEYASGLTNNFLFIPWHVPLKSVCKYLSVEALVSCRNYSIDLQSKSIDWFLCDSDFYWGAFSNRLQYSFIFGNNHRKVSFNFNTCGGFILGEIADFEPVVLHNDDFFCGRINEGGQLLLDFLHILRNFNSFAFVLRHHSNHQCPDVSFKGVSETPKKKFFSSLVSFRASAW